MHIISLVDPFAVHRHVSDGLCVQDCVTSETSPSDMGVILPLGKLTRLRTGPMVIGVERRVKVRNAVT